MRKLLLIICCLFVVLTSHSGAQASQEESYRVGIGDTINVTVVGHADLSISVMVAIDGTIAFPHIGTLYVKDKTLQEIETEITKQLSDGYLKYPVISVSLMSSVSKKIFIHGQGGSGAIPFEKDLSVIKALSLFGGVGRESLYGTLKVRRRKLDSKSYEVIIKTKLNKGHIEETKVEDMLLKPDDIIIIEPSETFFVRGEVAKIGALILEHGMTVARAIALAGGITDYGLHGKVKVRRKKEDSSAYFVLIESYLNDGNIVDSEVEDMLLQSDDILYVTRAKSYFIEGEIMTPSKYKLEYGITVGRAITLAGGITEGGTYGSVRVRRKSVGRPGYDDIEVDIEGIIEGKENIDMLLQPDDILIVDRNKTYIMYGEVNNIGEFSIQNDTTVFKAILAAGGFNKWGSESRVKILRPTEDRKGFITIKIDITDILDGDATADMPLEPGDIVVVSSGLF